MRFREFKQRLLVEMYHRQKGVGFHSFMEPKDVADAAGLIYEPGQIRLCLTEFKESGYVNAAFTMGGGPDGGLRSYLTARGIELAEEWEEELPDTPLTASSSTAPASDRVVAIDHNSAKYKKAVQTIDEVISEVDNNRSNDFVDKEQRLSELRAGRVLLNAYQVSVQTVKGLFFPTLRYLALKFADVPLGHAAKAAWEALLRLLGF
jgi:hypothetical protein